MRKLLTLMAASILMASGCSSSGGGGSGGPAAPGPASNTLVSCVWGSTCDQYSGAIDPTFATNLGTTCAQHGVAYATTACPSTNQVAGHCDRATTAGMADAYYYYSPTWDSASAKADCLSNVVGVTWVP